MKDVTMTLKQFMELQRKEKDLIDIRIENKNLLIIDPKVEKFIVFGVACTMFLITNTKTAYASEAIPAIDTIGNRLLGIAQQVGYWLCLVLCIKEILTEILQGNAITNPSDLAKPIVKYCIAFASIYFMPSLFDWIKEVF